jgi:hypothetical protein
MQKLKKKVPGTSFRTKFKSPVEQAESLSVKTLTNHQLKKKGFPKRPHPEKTPHAFKAWKKIFNKKFTVRKTEFVLHKRIKHRLNLRGRKIYNGNATENWCGSVYHPVNDSFQKITGTWTVPDVSVPPGTPDGIWCYCSIWVGISGIGFPDIVQAGTEHKILINGGVIQQQTYFWWEWLPEGEQEGTELPLDPGDSVTVVVEVNSDTQFTAYFTNSSKSYQHSVIVQSTEGRNIVACSAEWILERPKMDGALTPLANYQSFSMAGMTALTSSGNELDGGGGQLISMTDQNSNTISQPSAVNATEVNFIYI